MTEGDNKYKFASDVFKSELEEIAQRRKNALPAGSKAVPVQEALTIKNRLLGLAFSGGGIRSASFCLGVAQHLIKEGQFKKIDYLSTVSGGGYTGSSISALLSENPNDDTLLTERTNDAEPPALNHIRNYSEYLKVRGLFSKLRMPVLFAEGVARSLLTFLPFVILAVFLTEVFFEFSGRFSANTQRLIPLLGVLPLITALIIRPIFKDRKNWMDRENADGRLAALTALAIAAALSTPLLALLGEIVHHDASTLLGEIVDAAHGYPSVTLSLGALLLIAFIVGIIKQGVNLIVLLAGILAPVLLLLIYIFLCVEAINSPYLHEDERGTSIKAVDLLQAESRYPGIGAESIPSSAALSDDLHRKLRSLLTEKHINLDDYEASITAPDIITLDRKDEKPELGWVTRYLTSREQDRLTITLNEQVDTSKLVLQVEDLRISRGNAEWWLYLAGLLIQIYNWLFININRFSLHPFYRDRLSRTFLLRRDAGSEKPKHVDELKMSELNGANSSAPYHIINAALNLQGSPAPQLRSRKSVPFMFSKRFCGSDFTGYCVTRRLEEIDPHFNLGTAMAISAAAASPNMGALPAMNLSLLLTLLNIRLNYWLPHPRYVNKKHAKKSFLFKNPGLSYLLKEALSRASAKTPFINCSDGGHIENLAVYELLRRQCKTIICVDAEADPRFTFHGLATLQRYAQIDLGACIEIDLSGIRPIGGLSKSNYAAGNIYYDNGETGTFLYLKLSFTGREAEYIHHYRATHPAFPHESTGDQFFDETQFEVYRALGNYVASCAKDDISRSIGSVDGDIRTKIRRVKGGRAAA